MWLAARLKRYEIRATNRTKKDVAKYKAMSSAIANLFKFLSSVPDEIKLSYASEILMQIRGPDIKKDSGWKHEHKQTYTLLNQAIGARNNRVNAGAFSEAIPLMKMDLMQIIGAFKSGKT